MPADEERATALERVGMRHVALDPGAQTVRYQRPGLEINLGSIGKGYALDRVADMLDQDWGLPAFLLHGGFSSVYARGYPPGRSPRLGDRPAPPVGAGAAAGPVWLRDRGLGTSAATFQYLEHEGRKLGHVLDPRSGWPAAGMASVSVVAPPPRRPTPSRRPFLSWASRPPGGTVKSIRPSGPSCCPRADAEPVVLGDFLR